jgi:hypothetical protein
VFKIVRFPSKLNNFFSSLETQFLYKHFEYFKMLVLLIAVTWEQRNIQALYRYLDSDSVPHRTRFNNFLHVGRWNPQKALAMKAYELLWMLNLKKRESVYLIIDDSKKSKRGKKMEAVGWLHDHVSGRSLWGHQYIKAMISVRGHTIPFGVRLYVKKQDCHRLQVPFQKVTQLAAELIRSFQPPEGLKVIVVFDTYYLCPLVVRACQAQRFHFVSTLKANRNLFLHRRKLKAGEWATRLFRRTPKSVLRIPKEHGSAHYRYVDAGRKQVSKLGKLHIVISKKNRERVPVMIVTNHPSFSAARIIRAYDARWSIEVFFKNTNTKQLLGLGHYQNRPYTAAVTHLHLVCFAYALLTHSAIESTCAQETRSKKAHVSARELQNNLRRLVWHDTAQYLQELPDERSIFKELSRLLVAA